MKRSATLALAAILVTAPPITHQAAAQSLLDNITNEDIGRVLGGVGGALVGSQIGGGSGKLVAVAAGTLGGLFLGGEIGKQLDQRDQQAVADTRQEALDSGQTVSWENPDNGVQTTARVTETTYRPAPVSNRTDGADMVWQVPPMQLVGEDYRATTTINIRGGPSTEYAVMDQLQNNERIRVVGKLVDTNWFLVARNGIGRGFIRADLLEPTGLGSASVERPRSTENLAGIRECSVLEQEVRLADGTSEVERARACRNQNGKWELI